MTGLVWKDLLAARKTLKAYAMIFIFYLALSAFDILELSFVQAMTNIMVMMMPIGAFAYDEQARWDKYAMSMPLGRRAVVAARYLFTLFIALLAAAVGLLTCVLFAFRNVQPLAESLAAALTSMGVGLLIADITLPLSYQLGPERARPYFYAVCFVPFVLLLVVGKFGLLDGVDLRWVEELSDTAAVGLFALIPLAALAGLGLSFLISCRIMAQKEF